MSSTADRTCCLPGSCKLPLFIFFEELLLSFVRLCTVTRTPAPFHPISPFPFRPTLLLISKALYAVSHIFSPLLQSLPTSLFFHSQEAERAWACATFQASINWYMELNMAPGARRRLKSWFQVNRQMPKAKCTMGAYFKELQLLQNTELFLNVLLLS